MCKPALYAVPLLATLMLSGCDSDFATLTFENSVSANSGRLSGGVTPLFHEQLAELLRAQGIDPDLITLRTTNGMSHKAVLSEPVFGGLEPEQKIALQKALQDIVDKRNMPIGMTFTLRPEDMENASESVRQKAAELPRQYSIRVKLREAEVSIAYVFNDALNAALQGSQEMSSQSYCNVVAETESPLPFEQIIVVEDEQKGTSYALEKGLVSPYVSDRIPADVRFEDPELQSLLEQGTVSVSSGLTQSKVRASRSGGVTQFEIQIGPMGIVRHENTKVDHYAKLQLKTDCMDMAGALGRPFSYSMGESIDRLIAVSFY